MPKIVVFLWFLSCLELPNHISQLGQ